MYISENDITELFVRIQSVLRDSKDQHEMANKYLRIARLVTRMEKEAKEQS